MTETTQEGPSWAQVPTRQLAGEAESTYVALLRAILRRARLNLYYPDSRKLISHVEVLAPETHRGLYPGVQIDRRTGLPTYKEWTRAQTDVAVADDALSQLGSPRMLERKAEAQPDSIFAKQWAKYQYYSQIRGRLMAPLGNMDVALRRVDTETRTAYFHVVLDKLDASGVFVRYAIDLGQRDNAWSKALVRLDDETAEHTDALRSLIYRFTSLDAELTFIKLAELGNLEVERVSKGTIGPMYLCGVRPSGGPLAPVMGERDGPLATFALDSAALDQPEDRDNDPLAGRMTEKLSSRAREGYEKGRQKYGYKVYRDRKFVVTQDLHGPVKELCAEAGTKNIIYTI